MDLDPDPDSENTCILNSHLWFKTNVYFQEELLTCIHYARINEPEFSNSGSASLLTRNLFAESEPDIR
jgi:hypothetical protein